MNFIIGSSRFGASAFEYNGNILVFFFKEGGGLNYYTYYPNTDTYSGVTTISNTDWYTSDLYWLFIEKYEDDIYIYFSAYYNQNVARKYNLIDGTLTTISSPSLVSWSTASGYLTLASTSKIGNTMFVLTTTYGYNGSNYITGISTSTLKKFTLGGDGTTTTISMPTSSGTAVKLSAMYALGNYLYGFTYGTNQTKYYVYDIENNTWEERTSLIAYSIEYGYAYNFIPNTSLCVYDYNRGVLYIRVASTSLIDVFQLPNSPLSQDLDVGTVVINQDFSGQLVKLQDDSNLYVGISNVGIVDTESNEKYIDGDCLAFWGDGEKWNLLKNPNAETVTVSFNTDGGSGTFASQTVVIGQKATQPQNVPIKSGDYVFDSWYLGNEPYDWNYKPVSDITLTAHYLAYEEVDYIQSTGTQYIDTGVSGTFSTSIEFVGTFKPINTSSVEQAITGSKNSSNQGATVFMPSGNSSQLYSWCGSGTALVLGDLTVGNTNTLDITFYKTRGRDFTLNGVTTSDSTIQNDYTNNTENFGLFNDKANTLNSPIKMALYSWRIIKDGTLVRDFQPIQITSTGEYCLLDEVEHKVYHNAGTGNFRGEGYGPRLLEYIESTGTQYIEIPETLARNVHLEIKMSASADNAKIFSCGVYQSYLIEFQCRTNSSVFAGFYGSSGGYTWNISFNYPNNPVTIDLTNGVVKINSTTAYSTSVDSTSLSGNAQILKTTNGTSRLYSCYIQNSASGLNMNLLPALDDDDVPCLWDEINDLYLYNAGTGDFNYGSVINNG